MPKHIVGGYNTRISSCPYCSYVTQGSPKRSNLMLKLHLKICKNVLEEERSFAVRSVDLAPVSNSIVRNEIGFNSIVTDIINTNSNLNSDVNSNINLHTKIYSGSIEDRHRFIRDNIYEKQIIDTVDTKIDSIVDNPLSAKELLKGAFQVRKTNPELFNQLNKTVSKMRKLDVNWLDPNSVLETFNSVHNSIDSPNDILGRITDISSDIDSTDIEIKHNKKKKKNKKKINKNSKDDMSKLEIESLSIENI